LLRLFLGLLGGAGVTIVPGYLHLDILLALVGCDGKLVHELLCPIHEACIEELGLARAFAIALCLALEVGWLHRPPGIVPELALHPTLIPRLVGGGDNEKELHLLDGKASLELRGESGSRGGP
jgi:hypothetical protein